MRETVGRGHTTRYFGDRKETDATPMDVPRHSGAERWYREQGYMTRGCCMNRLPLTFACGRYDRTEALRTGEIQPEGIALNYIAIEASREIFDRMVGNREFDCAELSISEFIGMVSVGKAPFIAIPVFPSRAFRHGFIFINGNAGIRTPKDLEGKRIGTGLYTQTAAVYIRGHLQNDFGVDFSEVKWIQGAIEKPGAHGSPTTRPLLKPVNIVDNQSALLARGPSGARRDRRHGAGASSPGIGKNPDIVRLFPNFRQIERDLYVAKRILSNNASARYPPRCL